jgi:membrane protease YdiL (CAAX protease family)
MTATAVTESGLAPGAALLLSVFFYLVVAFNEEFAFRGYQLRNLAEGSSRPAPRPPRRNRLRLGNFVGSLRLGARH